MTIDINQVTFGVEIETYVSQMAIQTGQLRVGSRHNGTQVPYLPTGWKAEADGSIRCPSGTVGCEIVSPILKGPEGLNEVGKVLRTLREKGHKVNASCGVHCHIGWNRAIRGMSAAKATSALARLVTYMGYCESGMYAVTGTKTRENSQWCKSVKCSGIVDEAIRRAKNDRYHILNLTNLDGSKGTVEFRAFSGSTNITKVISWICLCLGIVDRALNGRSCRVKFLPAPIVSGGWRKGGLGRTETERMLGCLAWAEGTAKNFGGRAWGWIDNEHVTRTAAMKKLRALADQYDGNGTDRDLEPAPPRQVVPTVEAPVGEIRHPVTDDRSAAVNALAIRMSGESVRYDAPGQDRLGMRWVESPSGGWYHIRRGLIGQAAAQIDTNDRILSAATVAGRCNGPYSAPRECQIDCRWIQNHLGCWYLVPTSIIAEVINQSSQAVAANAATTDNPFTTRAG